MEEVDDAKQQASGEGKKDANKEEKEEKSDRKSRGEDRDRDRDKDKDRKDRDRERDRDRRDRRKERSRSKDRKERRRSRSRDRDRDRRSRRSRSRDRKPRRDRSRDRSRERRRTSDRRDRRSRSRDRRDRRGRRSASPDDYGYVPRKRMDSPDPVAAFQDPFAALRTQTKAMDPAEMARQMQEQQLRARQLVLQQQAASAVAAASKTQREVYVGNLLPGLVTGDMLRTLFNSTMAAAFPDKIPTGMEAVVNVSVHTEGRYAFVELISSEMATAALQLNNQVQLLGQTLSIGRPSGYVDPAKAAAAAQSAAEALAKFQSETAAMRRETGQVTEEEQLAEDTNYLCIDGMVTAEVLQDDAEYKEVFQDITEECNKFGTVLRVVVPRPADSAQAAEVMGTEMYGKACVQFLEVEGAQKAREAIHGRLFAGQTVTVTCMQPHDFMKLYQ